MPEPRKSEPQKSDLVRMNEAVANISEAVDKLRPHINRIAVTGFINCRGPDIEVMLACTRYVSARQNLDECLRKASE